MIIRFYQAHVSRSMGFFKSNFLSKYDLIDYKFDSAPLVIYGLYRDADIKVHNSHKGPLKVVFCGSDTLKTSNLKKLITRDDVEYYATSQFISKDLNKLGIVHTTLPITPAIIEDIKPTPLGDYIYFYGVNSPKFYNLELAHTISNKLKIPLIKAGSKTFNRTGLIKAYNKSFIGLRLTPHDGVAITSIELGLMGRPVLFNGDSPNSLPWNEDNALELVHQQYINRKKIDYIEIHNKVKKYLDIGDLWLYL